MSADRRRRLDRLEATIPPPEADVKRKIVAWLREIGFDDRAFLLYVRANFVQDDGRNVGMNAEERERLAAIRASREAFVAGDGDRPGG